MSVNKIVAKFGGVQTLRRALGIPEATVYAWVSRGRIPAKHQQSVLDAGAKAGIDISPQDFFRKPRKQASV